MSFKFTIVLQRGLELLRISQVDHEIETASIRSGRVSRGFNKDCGTIENADDLFAQKLGDALMKGYKIAGHNIEQD